jgi:hypothetical protein
MKDAWDSAITDYLLCPPDDPRKAELLQRVIEEDRKRTEGNK